MKNKRNLLKMILVLAVCAALLLCAGCQTPEEPNPSEPTHAGHTHNFSKAWKQDADSHWKSCVCGVKDAIAPHTDANGDAKCDDCNRSVKPPEGPTAAFATAEQMKKVVTTKTASAGGAITAHPGGQITYTITITNNNANKISVNVTDTIPEGTEFVTGCSNVSGKSLSWEVQNIEPGASKSVTYAVKTSYTVKQIRSAAEAVIIKGTAAKVMDADVAAPADVYVSETFNATDRKRIEMAIDALITANTAAYTNDMQPFSGVTLASMMYKVGFSSGLELPTDLTEVLDLIYDTEHGTHDLRARVAPTLYGGTAVPAAKDSQFRGSRATKVQLSDLISGDLIVTEKAGTSKLYIFDGIKLIELGATVNTQVNTGSVLSGLTGADRYAVIRASVNLNTHYSLEADQYFNDADKEAYTKLENAMIKTAETFLLRGDRLQYSNDTIGKSVDRAQSAVYQPEDYTVDQYGYTNSAYFTRDVHWATYGLASTAKCTDGSYRNFSTISWIMGCAAYEWDPVEFKGGNKSSIFYYECPIEEVDGVVVSKMSDAEKKELMDKFISLLRPGDVITYGALTGNVGHAMVYVGNGLIIHATGDNYNSDNRTDSHEAAVCYMAVTELFDEENFPQQYVFTQARFCINRPQKMRSASVTDNTASRIDNLFGIIAEKISSTAMGKTVNSGDEITYTFHVFNTNNTEKTVTIFDVLSEHVTFVSATNGGQVSDGNITWSLNVPADSRITVSYTVKVKDNLPAYTAIDGTKATINGVAHKCYNTYVVNTLTAAEQQKLVEAVNTVKGMDVTGLNSVQLANLIYKTAFGVDNIFGENVTDFGLLFNGNGTENVGVFGDSVAWANSAFMIIKDANPSKGAMMAAPGMFGGAYTFNGYTKYNGNEVNEPYNRYTSVTGGILRSRYYQEKDLVVGDIFLMKSASQQYLYLYLGNDIFVSLGESLEVFTQQSVSELFQYAPADVWKYHVILRPSMVLDI